MARAAAAAAAVWTGCLIVFLPQPEVRVLTYETACGLMFVGVGGIVDVGGGKVCGQKAHLGREGKPRPPALAWV